MSNYLTRRNYHGPNLHQNIRGRSEQSPSTDTKSYLPIERNMDPQEEAKIFALPESSDEEDNITQDDTSKDAPSSMKRKAEEEGLPASKRRTSPSISTRSSQRKSQSTQPETAQGRSFSIPEVDDWLVPRSSQSSQSQRLKAGYGKNSFHRSTRPARAEHGLLSVPDEATASELATPKKTRSKGFAQVQDVPVPVRNTPKKALRQPPPDVGKHSKATAKFSLPEDPSPEPSSSLNSLEAENLRIFDTNNAPNDSRDRRRGSTSSLSSVDSIASALLSQSQKDDLKNGVDNSQTLSPGFVSCPLCNDPVRINPNDKSHPSKLSLRAQQAYCHTHKLSDAHTTWQERSYPTISWSDLESRRIPAHIPYLSKVLSRKIPSFYFDALDAVVKSAKGNKRKINAYLLEGIMDVARLGYYGAKGAKIMSHKITTSFAKQLKMALTQDKVVGTAGVSGFTSAVLLPELCQRLVVEDMGIEDQEEARRVINESSDVGLLLYPDDDHVDLAEGNDED